MNNYIVSWKVEIAATSPEAAAELAYLSLQDYPRGSKVVFEVAADDGDDAFEVVVVDDTTGIASSRQ